MIQPIEDFQNPKQEWRRLFSELFGTFLLVLVAAGGGMMSQAFPDTISRQAAVVAPGLMVMAIILFMGKVSGAHLNPAVSLAFAPEAISPGGGCPATSWCSWAGQRSPRCSSSTSSTCRRRSARTIRRRATPSGAAFWMEFILTLGLVSVILGTASGAQNIGIVGAFGVGGYIALAGLWGSPISGASMNPARTFGPDLIGRNFTDYWVYVAGPIAGAALAVVVGVRAARSRWRQGGIRRRAGRLVHRGRASRQGLSICSRADS